MSNSVVGSLLWLFILGSHSDIVSSLAREKNAYLNLSRRDAQNRKGADDNVVRNDRSQIVFPGGGIFFYWQAGAVTYLREAGYDLSKVQMTGASAGALTATLTAADVDFYDATNLALKLAREGGVWERRGGLQGIWGPMIVTWLDELLPIDAVEKVAGRLSLLVTPVPSFGKTRIESFNDRSDLIKCNMASVHLPYFLDGRLTCDFRGSPHIDGSFLATEIDYLSVPTPTCIGRIDWKADPAMAGRALEFVKAVPEKSLWDMIEYGKAYARKIDAEGGFDEIFS